MTVAPLPEVEGRDGPEEQQHGARNEDHGSGLEQPRGAGGLHGHRGVRLRAGGAERGSRLRPARSGPRAAPAGLGRVWPSTTQSENARTSHVLPYFGLKCFELISNA